MEHNPKLVGFLEVAFLKATSHHITRGSSETSVNKVILDFHAVIRESVDNCGQPLSHLL